MSPITAAARQRLEEYLRAHTVPNDPPPPNPDLFRRLLDHLIYAAHDDHTSDPF